jgi:tripartite-type tricarboxylate transporter receptor subunit TctC
LPYDPDKDFVPVTIAVKFANILVVHPAVPAKSLGELVAYAKANPGKLTYASQGNGSSGHIVAEQLKQIAGIDVVHVPYCGAAPAVQDLVAGHVSMSFDILALALPQFRAETVRALVITSPQRDPLFPGVPTTAEVGYPQLEGGAPGSASSFRQRRHARSSTGCMRRRSEHFRVLRTASDLPSRA